MLRIVYSIPGGLGTACPTVLAIAWLILVTSANAASIAENFSSDPFARGWRSFGDTTLFKWNSTNQNLEVTWDSSRTNSYFWLPLRTIISKIDAFNVAFDLTLREIAIGTSSNKLYTFQIAIGFLNFSSATATNFFRGAGQSSFGPRNLVEFDYFPDSGFGATLAPTEATTNNRIFFSDNHPLQMTAGDLFHIALTASNQVLKTSITKNGVTFGPIKDLALTNFDFRCDSLAIMSYGDAIQVGSPQFWGSVLAHGVIDNLSATFPDPPVQNLSGSRSNSTWRAHFVSRTNWNYFLERTTDLVTWNAASPTNTGTDGVLVLQDTNATSAKRFYRINAFKP